MKHKKISIIILLISISFLRFGGLNLGKVDQKELDPEGSSTTTQKIDDKVDYTEITQKSADELSTDIEGYTNHIEENGIQVYNAQQLKNKLSGYNPQQIQSLSARDYKAIYSLFYEQTVQNQQAGTTTTVNNQQVPTGQVPNGQIPTGQVPNGQIPTGQVPNGQIPTGQVANGQIPTGQVPNQGDSEQQIDTAATVPGAVLGIMDNLTPVLPPKVQGVVGTVKNIWENVGPIARQFCAASMVLAKELGAPESVLGVMGNVSQLVFGMKTGNETADTGQAILRGFNGLSDTVKSTVDVIRQRHKTKFASNDNDSQVVKDLTQGNTENPQNGTQAQPQNGTQAQPQNGTQVQPQNGTQTQPQNGIQP